MDCPHCHSPQVSVLQRKASLGYPMFRCKACCRTFNERAVTPFNFVEISTDIIFQVLLCRVRYKLSYRDVIEFFLLRGFQFTHETVRFWEERFLLHFTDQIRTKRKGKVVKIWLINETFIRIKGVWCYIYRGIDADGNLVEVCLSKTRDMAAPKPSSPRPSVFTRMLQIRSLPMAWPLAHEQLRKHWAKISGTRCAPAPLTQLNKVTEGLSIAIIPPLDSASLMLSRDSAELSMKWATF